MCMKTFKRIQAILAAVSFWVALAISNNPDATGNETLASTVLVLLAGTVVINVLIERAKEESK